MSLPKSYQAIAFAYDIGMVIDQIQPYLAKWNIPLTLRETVIDHWVAHTVHEFEIVSVANLTAFGFTPAQQLTQFRQCSDAISTLWKSLWLPWEISGSEVVIYRSHRALYLITIDKRF